MGRSNMPASTPLMACTHNEKLRGYKGLGLPQTRKSDYVSAYGTAPGHVSVETTALGHDETEAISRADCATPIQTAWPISGNPCRCRIVENDAASSDRTPPRAYRIRSRPPWRVRHCVVTRQHSGAAGPVPPAAAPAADPAEPESVAAAPR